MVTVKNIMKHSEEEINKLAHSIQKECYQLVEQMMDYMRKNKKKTNITSQDLTNIFFYKKLAEIELRLRELERKTTISFN